MQSRELQYLEQVSAFLTNHALYAYWTGGYSLMYMTDLRMLSSAPFSEIIQTADLEREKLNQV